MLGKALALDRQWAPPLEGSGLSGPLLEILAFTVASGNQREEDEASSQTELGGKYGQCKLLKNKQTNKYC